MLLILELVPPDIEKEVRNLYISLLELLSQFWRCFPPINPELEETAIRMHEALKRFQIAKLKPFEVNYNYNFYSFYII